MQKVVKYSLWFNGYLYGTGDNGFISCTNISRPIFKGNSEEYYWIYYIVNGYEVIDNDDEETKVAYPWTIGKKASDTKVVEPTQKTIDDNKQKAVDDVVEKLPTGRYIKDEEKVVKMSKKEKQNMLLNIETEMREAAKNMDFERAMELRDILFELKS